MYYVCVLWYMFYKSVIAYPHLMQFFLLVPLQLYTVPVYDKIEHAFLRRGWKLSFLSRMLYRGGYVARTRSLVFPPRHLGLLALYDFPCTLPFQQAVASASCIAAATVDCIIRSS